MKEERLALSFSPIFPLGFSSKKALLERRQFMPCGIGEGLGREPREYEPLNFIHVFKIVFALCLCCLPLKGDSFGDFHSDFSVYLEQF